MIADTTAELTASSVYANSAGADGGGVYAAFAQICIYLHTAVFKIVSSTERDMHGNTFTNNSAQDGGGMHIDSSQAFISNCTYTLNAAYNGAALYLTRIESSQ